MGSDVSLKKKNKQLMHTWIFTELKFAILSLGLLDYD